MNFWVLSCRAAERNQWLISALLVTSQGETAHVFQKWRAKWSAWSYNGRSLKTPSGLVSGGTEVEIVQKLSLQWSATSLFLSKPFSLSLSLSLFQVSSEIFSFLGYSLNSRAHWNTAYVFEIQLVGQLIHPNVLNYCRIDQSTHFV